MLLANSGGSLGDRDVLLRLAVVTAELAKIGDHRITRLDAVAGISWRK